MTLVVAVGVLLLVVGRALVSVRGFPLDFKVALVAVGVLSLVVGRALVTLRVFCHLISK